MGDDNINSDSSKPGMNMGGGGPAHVAHFAGDLPSYETIISGSSPKAIIHVPDNDPIKVVVLQKGHNAYIVADKDLHGKMNAVKRFREIRTSLEAKKYQEIRVIWALESLVTELQKVKSMGGGSSTGESVASSQTELAQRFREWVDYALEEGASDFHIEVRKTAAKARFRIYGDLENMRTSENGIYIPAIAQNTIAYIYNKMTDAKSQSNSQFQSSKHSYSMVTYGEGDKSIKLRCQTIALVNGFDFVARLLRTESAGQKLTYRQLGYAASQAKLIENATTMRRGLILIAGVTGSGKTTTIKTIMQSIPGRELLKLASIEDPVEYIIEGVSQTATQRDVSDDEESAKVFAEAVKSWMRGDPDVLMVGEIRDLASGVAALTEAETGHMALGTVHANNAPGILQRLVSPAIGLDLFALTAPGIISLLIYQALLPTLCPNCKIPLSKMSDEVRDQFNGIAKKFRVDVSNVHFRNHKGCPSCKLRGTKGMTVAAEIIKPDRKFLSLMRQRLEFDAIDHWLSSSDGRYDTENMNGKTVFQHAFYLALQGLVDGMAPEMFDLYDDVIVTQRGDEGGA